MTGCAPHIVDKNPITSVQPQAAFSAQGASAPTGSVNTAAPWYASFNEPVLTQLIEASLDSNLDVQQAIARLKQAHAITQSAHAQRLPELSLDADASIRRQDSQPRETSTGIGPTLSWEADAFNRIGAGITARKYEEEAAAADVEAVRLSLAAEIAQSWFSAVAQNVQLRLLRQQSSTDNKLLDLVRQRLDAGVGTQVDVLQQESQLAENDSLIPPAEANLRVFENRLDVLSGNAPDAINRTAPNSDFSKIETLPAIGVPSDLLLNRPDLRALKNLLIASDAGIAAAMAERLPRITLTGSYMLAGGSAGGSAIASALAGLVQPLLDWGRREAEVKRNKALYEERLAAFTQAYLVAVEDVENALYRENRQREYITRLEARKNLLLKNLEAAESVYRQGESDYLPVLGAIKDLRLVERDLVNQRLNLVLYRIQLYRALGGQGMDNPTATETAS